MSDDIVEQLRVLNHHAKKLAENESLHDLHRDALTRCENMTWKAADEIERLRELLGLERVYSAQCAIDRKETQREREEARREVCKWVAMMTKQKPSTVAKDRDWNCFRGWNCFKETTNEH